MDRINMIMRTQNKILTGRAKIVELPTEVISNRRRALFRLRIGDRQFLIQMTSQMSSLQYQKLCFFRMKTKERYKKLGCATHKA